MRKIRFFFKILWIVINFIFLFFAISIMLFLCTRINENYMFLLILLIFGFVITLFYYQFSNQLTYIVINESVIKVYKPLRFQKYYLKIEEIRGYSVSEVCHGRNLYSSKSFVIYSNSTKEIEIIDLFNLNFDESISLLKKYRITKLGKEPYITGFCKRKYKF